MDSNEAPRRVWVQVVVAAVLMFATLPARTQGLGLFTEPMLKDLAMDRSTFATINLGATLIGSLLCFPAGFLLDRFDRRWVTITIVLALAISVWALGLQHAAIPLFVCLIATRGFGQSALSVASITWIAKVARERSRMPMAWYTVLLSVLFAAGFGVVGLGVRELGWRKTAFAIAAVLAVAVAPLPFLGRARATGARDEEMPQPADVSLSAAMKTVVFWLFAVAISLFAYVSSGIGLFNESILAERGFDRKAFEMFLIYTTLAALGGQVLCGWLGRWHKSKYLLAEALVLYAAGLGSISAMTQRWQLWAVAAVVGIAAGMMTVLFFSVWGEVFGKAQLGRIQGVAQMCTVLASAAGPVAFANAQATTGSYQSILSIMAGVAGALAVLGCFVRMPQKTESAVTAPRSSL